MYKTLKMPIMQLYVKRSIPTHAAWHVQHLSHQKSLMWYKMHKINKFFKVIKLEQIIHPIIDPFHINSGMYHM